jgi:glutaredoxin
MFGWWRRRPRRPDLEVTLYTRAACPLCDKSAAVLRAAQRQYSFRLSAVDIDSDPALVARYGWLVPVVVIEGKERFRGCVNPVLLERLLRALP